MADVQFLRPLWLLALVPVALLVWRLLHGGDRARAWRGIVDEHLLPHLLRGNTPRAGRAPPLVLAATWTALVIALAGPSFRREPTPFAEDSAVLAIVLKVTPSMRVRDVAPDRLTRAVQKIDDLLARRAGARTALIAYAGSAHVVMPLTRDAEIIRSFARSLDPAVMPEQGDVADEALALAAEEIERSGRSGSILWITDGVSDAARQATTDLRRTSDVPVAVLGAVPPGGPAKTLEGEVGDVTVLTPDDSDVVALAERATTSVSAAAGEGSRPQDAGWFLTPLIALLALASLRRGFVLDAEAAA